MSKLKCLVFTVVGTDTGVGKTIFTGLLGKYLALNGCQPQLLKPFCSGGREDIEFLNVVNDAIEESKVNYWYGHDPISPAAWELAKGDQINFEDIVKKLKQQFIKVDCDIILVEGVGGLLAPISKNLTVASLSQELGSNLIIVAQNRVGVINHVLLTVEAAISRGLSVAWVVLMEQEAPDATAIDNAELIRLHIPNMTDFKGVFEFPWLGRGASNPDLISSNIKKAHSVLEKIFDEGLQPYFINVFRN